MTATVHRIHPTYSRTEERLNQLVRVLDDGAFDQVRQIVWTLVEEGPYRQDVDVALRERMHHFPLDACFEVVRYSERLSREMGFLQSGSIELVAAYHGSRALKAWSDEGKLDGFNREFVDRIMRRVGEQKAA